MAPKNHEALLKNLHPFLFVLKEGKRIKEDFFDYSLLMLQVTNAEVIRSPHPPLTGAKKIT